MKKLLFTVIKALRACLPAAFFISTYLALVNSRYIKSVLHRLLLTIIPEKISLPWGTLNLNTTDPVISTALLFNVYEPYATKIFLHHLRPGMTVIDVGANIGYYSVLAASVVGSTGQIYAFEPDPENFALLQQNAQTNSMPQIKPVAAALSEQTGKSTLYLSPDNKGDHRIVSELKEDRKGVVIDTWRFDEFAKHNNINNVNLIKIDVQGAENFVLKGMEQTLQGSHSLVLFLEYWPAGLAATMPRPTDLIERLWNSGFVIYEISEKDEALILVDKKWPSLESYTDRTYLNLLCYKL